VAEYYSLYDKDKPVKKDKHGNYSYQSIAKNLVHFDDILVFNIDNTAGIKWIQKIAKNQVSDFSMECSYYSVEKDDTLHLVYNQPAVDDQNKTEANTVSKTMQSTVSLSGDVSTEEELRVKKEQPFFILPKLHILLGENELVLYLYNEKQLRLGTIKL